MYSVVAISWEVWFDVDMYPSRWFYIAQYDLFMLCVRVMNVSVDTYKGGPVISSVQPTR